MSRGRRLVRGAGMRRHGKGIRRAHMRAWEGMRTYLVRWSCRRARGSWRPVDGLRDGPGDGAEGLALTFGACARRKKMRRPPPPHFRRAGGAEAHGVMERARRGAKVGARVPGGPRVMTRTSKDAKLDHRRQVVDTVIETCAWHDKKHTRRSS